MTTTDWWILGWEIVILVGLIWGLVDMIRHPDKWPGGDPFL